MFQKNERVIYLDMSHNEFSEEGAFHVGRAIGKDLIMQYGSDIAVQI